MGDELTDMQRAILDALQRPLRDGGPYATPATNKQIAAEVHLSVDAVKGHLRALYARAGIDALPQNAKRARLAEIGLSGQVDSALAPRPPEPRSQRGRIPAMLSAVALGLVLLGVVVGLMLGRDGGDTFISQQPGLEAPGGQDGKRAPLADLPGPSSDGGLFAAGPAVPAGYEVDPVTVPAPTPSRERAPGRTEPRTQAKTKTRPEPRPSPRKPAQPPAPAATAPVVTTAPTPTRRARRTCTTRRQVTYRPRTVTVKRVRLVPRQVRRQVVRYRREVRMVPVQRRRKGRQGQGPRSETVMVRQVRRVPVVTYVTRTRMRRQVRFVKVTRRQRVVRSVRTCR